MSEGGGERWEMAWQREGRGFSRWKRGWGGASWGGEGGEGAIALTLVSRGVQLDLLGELCHQRELIQRRRVDGLKIERGGGGGSKRPS